MDTHTFDSGEFTMEQIQDAARSFIQAIGSRKVFAFYGKMGAGKTTFIKALCRELGVEDAVTSPTFALVNEYRDSEGNPIYHFDFYRIKRLAEAYDMGCEEYFDSGHLCLIEWPEMVEEVLPDDVTNVHICENPNGTRTIVW